MPKFRLPYYNLQLPISDFYAQLEEAETTVAMASKARRAMEQERDELLEQTDELTKTKTLVGWRAVEPCVA